MAKHTTLHDDGDVDALPELCRDAGVNIAPDDGLLLIRVDKAGHVHPEVLRLGLLTEGRLEMAIMSVYSAVVRARVRESNRLRNNPSAKVA